MDDVIAYAPSLVEGTWLTIRVGLLSLALAMLLGLLGAWGKLSAHKPARWAANTYTTIIRGVPDLVLMLLIFYGGQFLVNDLSDQFGWGYVEIDAFTAGVLTIGFIFGAYMTETFRGAALAIPKGEIEAGVAAGMSRVTLFRRIVWPQLLRYALPSFGNNWLVLVKTTALCSVIGLEDVVRKADLAGKSVREPFTFMAAVMVIFLIITSLSLVVLGRLEKHYTTGMRRA
jgi:histidine transport system permease protein